MALGAVTFEEGIAGGDGGGVSTTGGRGGGTIGGTGGYTSLTYCRGITLS
ncbi:hypothetical protein GCM10023185_01610 [Hymenobacter saemangeumensis]|uniref:Uncharacterized protein n=1 Tax=Hymenobacter saemangeumensis TaxID=1084522 RepID=A0ABP8HXI0_9BACT